MPSENIKNLAALRKLVGRDMFARICCDMYGETIRIPSCFARSKWQKVKDALASGKKNKAIAAECGCSERYVYMVRDGRVKKSELQTIRREISSSIHAELAGRSL